MFEMKTECLNFEDNCLKFEDYSLNLIHFSSFIDFIPYGTSVQNNYIQYIQYLQNIEV